jgi:hypothetical protein
MLQTISFFNYYYFFNIITPQGLPSVVAEGRSTQSLRHARWRALAADCSEEGSEESPKTGR